MSTIEGSIKLDMDRVMPHARDYVAECTQTNTNTVWNKKYMTALSYERSYDQEKFRNFYVDVEGLVKLVKWGLYV